MNDRIFQQKMPRRSMMAFIAICAVLGGWVSAAPVYSALPIGKEPAQALLLSEAFDDCTLAGWQRFSVNTEGVNTDDGWSCSEEYSNIEANGYGGSSPANVWLITPALNLDAQDDEQLRFRTHTGFIDDGQPYPQLSVKYAEDYDGTGNPTTATWTALPDIIFSAEDSDEWSDSGLIDLSTLTGDNVYFAFHYLSSGTSGGSAARWRLDSVDFLVSSSSDSSSGSTAPDETAVPYDATAITPIHAIQGNGAASPLVGKVVIVEAIVVADFQGEDALRGFFVQEEEADIDADMQTSEGLFIYEGDSLIEDVRVGDLVRIEGTVTEFNQLTELKELTKVEIVRPNEAVPAAALVTLPETVEGELEQYEGMLVQISDDSNLFVAQNYFLGRYGQMTLSAGQRIYQPTHQEIPGSAAAKKLAVDNAKRLLILDDGQDISGLGDNPNPVPYMDGAAPNSIRAGDRVSNLIGVLDFGRINSAREPARDYRLHPTEPPLFTATNPRSDQPDDVGGTLKVAAFNVLNYFTTIDNGESICSPEANQDCRGADSASELIRQRDKIVVALQLLDADIVGLIELENNGAAAPANDGIDPVLQDLVDALNTLAGAGTYTFIDAGAIGSDAIKVAFIYKPATVTPYGSFQILDSTVDPGFIDTKSRPVLAQTFQQNSDGERLTLAVNHLKSKGSSCEDIGDPTDPDGQGNCNQTRADAAIALANWLATDPTASGDADFLILGDLNAYAMEDPITALKEVGYTDLIHQFRGNSAYSYTFDGMAGYLDHALATSSLTAQVTGIVEWHINTDEPAFISYDEDYNPAGYYSADSFRSSDHDPVLVGLDLGGAAHLDDNSTQSIVENEGTFNIFSFLAKLFRLER